MELTFKVAFPVLFIVKVLCEVLPTTTLPKAILPLKLMEGLVVVVPVPLQGMVFVPLAAFEFAVIVPL